MLLFSRLAWGLAALVAALFAAACSGRASGAEFSVQPLRAVLTPQSQRQVFRVVNPGDRVLVVNISWADLAATDSGYRAATPEERAAFSAAPYLTIRPATLRIDPGASAEVTIAVKNPGQVPAGERRSHLLIDARATRTPVRRIGGLEADIDVAVTTPVFLRGAQGPAQAKLGDTKFSRSPDGLLTLTTSVTPAGSLSAYGTLAVDFAEAGGKTTRLGEIGNVSAYLEAASRRFEIPLGVARLPAGTLTLSYTGAAEFSGALFAQRSFAVAAPAPEKP